jgi:hypothetical protein
MSRLHHLQCGLSYRTATENDLVERIEDRHGNTGLNALLMHELQRIHTFGNLSKTRLCLL